MSNNGIDDENDPEYRPNQSIRSSMPMKKTAYSTKLLSNDIGLSEGTASPPRKNKKKATKSKANQGNKEYNTGRWTKEEHEKFMQAIEIHGRDWK